jgi:ABC-type polysaccharide/polyol phosphate export permease
VDRLEGDVDGSGVSAARALVRLVRYRECLFLLVVRALRVRYRRSVIGFGWTLLYPLLAMAVLTAVFSHVFADVERYPVYVIVGVLVWSFFSVACVQAMDALLGGSAILKKVGVPSAVFPLAAVGANVVNFVLSLAVLVVAGSLAGVVEAPAPAVQALWLATGLLSVLAFTFGVALMLASANLFFHDVRYSFEALMLVWFYATPVVYPAAAVPAHLAWLVQLNPFHWFLELLRAALWSAQSPAAGAGVIAPAIGAATLAAGWLLFTRLERRFYLVW